jgi:hypothetical protein
MNAKSSQEPGGGSLHRSGRIAGAGVTSMALLCLVALASRSDPLAVSGGVPAGPASAAVAALGGIVAAVGLLVLVALTWALLPRQRRIRREAPPEDDLPRLPLRLLLPALSLVVAVLAATVAELALAAHRRRVALSVGAGIAGLHRLAVGAERPLPLVPFAVAAAAVLVLAGGTVVWVLLRVRVAARAPGGRRDRGPAAAQELAAAVEESLSVLQAGLAPRAAVIAAYARMERVLAAAGLARGGPEAPREYLSRVAPHLAGREGAARQLGEAATTLTGLFEEARYSPHEIGEDARRAALRALGALHTALVVR